jgi:hypothetical protein
MKHIAFAFLLLFVASTNAATKYVRAGATGNGSGSDWVNAYTALPTPLTRGDTYYVADGNYGPYRFAAPVSGTSSVTVRKATVSDHGTSVGWSDAYGDGNATFQGPSPVWQIGMSFLTIDGAVGQGKGGVPYGFRVVPTSSKCSGESASAVTFVDGSHVTDLVVRHLELTWDNGTQPCTSAVPALLHVLGATSDRVTIENSYFHTAPGFAFYIGAYDPNPGGKLQNRYTIRNNYFYRLGGGGSADHHWEPMWLMNVDNSDIYNNVMEDVLYAAGQTGWVMMAKANNVSIHGNVFFCTDPACIVGGNGVIATWSLDAYRNDDVRIYNNTFYNLRGVFNDFGIRFTHNSVVDTNIIVKNNLYCNARFTWSGVTTQSHEACGCGQPCSGSSAQTGIASSLFVEDGSGNLRLRSGTTPGDASIGSKYGVDIDGRARGADGIWDRGAFEFGFSIALPPPTNLRVQ